MQVAGKLRARVRVARRRRRGGGARGGARRRERAEAPGRPRAAPGDLRAGAPDQPGSVNAGARRKILFLIPSLQLGGAERVVVLLLQNLPRERFELHLGLVEKSGEFLRDLPARRGRARSRRGPRAPRALPAGAARAPAAPRRDRAEPRLPEHVPARRAAAPAARARIVPIEHTTLSAEVAEQARPALWTAAYRALYPRADRIVACSHAIADDLVTSFGVDSRAHPHDPQPDRRDEDRGRRSRAGSSPFPGDGPHIVGVGRLAHVKGYDRLIEAFALLVGGGIPAELWLVGDGPDRATLEARAGGAGRWPSASTSPASSPSPTRGCASPPPSRRARGARACRSPCSKPPPAARASSRSTAPAAPARSSPRSRAPSSWSTATSEASRER